MYEERRETKMGDIYSWTSSSVYYRLLRMVARPPDEAIPSFFFSRFKCDEWIWIDGIDNKNAETKR